jgi:hypothetical protein
MHSRRSSTIPKLLENVTNLQNILLKENIQTNHDEHFKLVHDNGNNLYTMRINIMCLRCRYVIRI